MTADTAYPVHELVARRWSPRAFADRPLPAGAVGSLLEAARWAASSYNEQPWTFLVAARHDDPEGFERLAACLVEGNAWARSAPLLGLSVARQAFTRNGKPNRHAWHDVGLATAQLVLQAEALGLAAHLMAGFDPTRAREVLAIPDGHEPVAMFAVGQADETPSASRARLPLAQVAHGARWESPLTALEQGGA